MNAPMDKRERVARAISKARQGVAHNPVPHQMDYWMADAAIAALEPPTAQEAARVLLDAMNNGLDAFDVDGDNELQGLAIKWSGNMGDAVIQLEIAEEFMREALRALAGDADG